jgi:hypothetical protein
MGHGAKGMEQRVWCKEGGWFIVAYRLLNMVLEESNGGYFFLILYFLSGRQTGLFGVPYFLFLFRVVIHSLQP